MRAASATDHEAGPRGWALCGLLCGPFMSMVDSSAVNVAVPEIVRDTGASLALVGWAVSAYLLGIAASLPLTTALARRFGDVRVYTAALIGFGLTSACCALAPDVSTLIGTRALQGVAAAPMIPLALAMLFGGNGTRQGSPAAGLLLFLAPALGPTLGALLMTPYGWRAIFVINIPVVLLGLWAVRHLPRETKARSGLDVDLPAMLLLTVGSLTTVVGATLIADRGNGQVVPGIATAAGGLLVLVGWGYRVRQHRSADLAPHLLGSARHRSGVLVAAVASVVLFGVLFLVPVHFVGPGGWTLMTAGLVLLPQGIVMGLAHPLGVRLERRIGFRSTVVAGLLVLLVSSLLLLTVDRTTPPVWVTLILMLRGLALGLTLQPMITGLMRATPADQITGVSTLFTISQRVGASLGISLIAVFYQSRQGTAALHETALLLAVVSLLALVPAARLPARAEAAPTQVTPRR